jgi:hypothetical protein
MQIADEVALKVRDTLGAVLAAKTRATDANEKQFAEAAVSCTSFRIVLHIDLPARRSAGQPDPIKIRADLRQRLVQLAKSVDAHPLVVGVDDTAKVPWSVNQLSNPVTGV